MLIVEENHTFDAYFGRYCKAEPGSNPTCTMGPACCESAPRQEPGGATPIVLDDASNFAADRDHAQDCELQQIDGGKMDRFVAGSVGAATCLGVGPSCSSPSNWALAGPDTMAPYWALADGNALADRYFQPVAGSTASNNMYFAVAHFQFFDNAAVPIAVGSPSNCTSSICLDGMPTRYSGRNTVADLILQAGKTFTVYADGYAGAVEAGPSSCASIPPECPYSSCLDHPLACHGCIYDASDIPFVYYKQFADSPHIKDYLELQRDLDAGALPNFAFVKARLYRNEHPNVSTISDGAAFVTDTIDRIEASSYADNTLVLLTWDEGGGFFDHVSPPASIDTDTSGKPVPYGTRVPFLAVGSLVRKGVVSHVRMEHSSIVRFLEYNFVGPVGQLGFNDAKVNNLGSLLDPSKTGIRIPE